MKFRNLILAVIAGAALLTGCNKEVDLGPAKLEVNPTDVAFSQSAIASQDITLTATRDWAVTGLPDWIALSKESGSANTQSQTITLSVTENKGNNRSATLTFTIGFARANIAVSQVGPEGEVDNGDGTKDKPFNVAGVIDYVNELGADVTSPKNVYVMGKISAISEAFTTQYGNGSFVISDDGETTGSQFTAYRVLYLGNKKFASGDTQIEVGDDVIVYGKVVNYKGNTPETSQNAAFLYSLNGVNKGGDEGGGGGESAEPQGTGALDNPFNVAAAIAKAVETGETATETEYYIKGKVGEVKEQFSAQYGNATFTMVDEGFSATFTAFRVLYFDNQKWALGGKELAAGDEVIVCAKIVNFKGNTPETSGGYVYSINGEGGSVQPGGEDTPKGTGTQADPYNPKAAADLAATLETGAKTENDVYIKGTISSIKYTFSAQYGTATFNISEDGTEKGTQFTCYSVYYYDNKPWVEGNDQVEVGKEVLICGKLTNYNGTLETASKEAWIVSMGGGGFNPPSGEGTLENPFTVEQAIAKAVETGTTATTDVYFIKGKVAAVSLSAQYKNADLDLIDEGKPEAIFKAFRIKGFEGADITGEEPIIVGDEVVVCGNIVYYNSSIPETTQGGKLVTWNGKTSFDGGGVEPGGDVDFDKATTIKLNNESTWTEATDGTYKAGFETTSSNGIKVGVYKHSSTSNIIAPDQYSARVYKSAVISISAPAGKKVLGVRFKANDVNSGQYCKPLTVIEGGSGVINADATTFLIGDWTGSADRVVFQAVEAQTRLVEAYVVLDGEGGDTPGGDTPGGDDPKLPVNDGLTEETAFTIEDAVYVSKTLTDDKEFYVKAVVGKDISIKNGTASFELLDGTTDEKLTVVKAKSFDGAEFDGTEPLDWLDEVVLKGKVKEYSTLPALLEAVFIKWNGKTSFKEPDPDFTSIASLNALATSSTATEYTGTLENAVVSFVPNANNAIIKDATGSTLLYKSGHGLKQGQTFSGKTTVKVQLYQGAGELTAIDAIFTGDEAVVAPQETTLANLVADFGKWQSAYVKVSNLEVTGVSGKNVNVKDGDNTYVVFSSAGNATCAVGDKLTVTGTICQYNSVCQLKAWTLDAIEVMPEGDFTSIASLNALATSATATEYTGKLTNAVVSFVPNTKNAIIKDATGSTLLYLNNHGLKQGQTFSGKTTVKVQLYQGAGELTAIDAAFTGDEAVVAPEETTLAALVADFGKWQSAYVKVSNLEVTGVSGKNVNVKDGDNTYVVFSSAGNATCAVGDKLTVTGTICQYNNVCQIKAWTLDAIEVSPAGGGDEPGGGDTPGGETSAFASNVTWTLGTKAYDEKATVNEVADVAVLKLGTSSAIGNATLTVPATATKLTFYAVSWSGKQSKLVFKSGETELGSVEPAANSGLASSSPYTLTVTDTDKYEISFTAGVTSITVETTGSNKRAALFAVNAQ